MTYKHKFSGVYKIENIRNGKIYIGSTGHFYHRKAQHLHDLRNGQHWLLELQKDFAVFGEQFFRFVLLEEMPGSTKDSLLIKEQEYINNLNPEYNKSTDSRYGKYVFTDEIKQKISLSVSNRWKEGTYDKSHKGVNHFLINGKPNRLGVKLSDETKEKIRQANLGSKNPNYGTHKSDETKRKIGMANGKVYSGVVSPEGIVYPSIKNMSEFCREHDLVVSSMVSVMHDRRKAHRGWTKLSESG